MHVDGDKWIHVYGLHVSWCKRVIMQAVDPYVVTELLAAPARVISALVPSVRPHVCCVGGVLHDGTGPSPEADVAPTARPAPCSEARSG